MWDIRNHRCLQTFFDKEERRAEDSVGVMYYDPYQKWLVTGCKRLRAWPLKSTVSLGKDAHSAPVTCVLYNLNFNEVCSACTPGVPCLKYELNGCRDKL